MGQQGKASKASSFASYAASLPIAWTARLLKASLRHPLSTLTIALVAAAVSVIFLPRVELRLDGRSLIPARHSLHVASDLAAQRFDLRDVIAIGVTSPEGIYRPQPLALVARLSSEMQDLEGVVSGSVASLATVPRLFVEGQSLSSDPLLTDDGPVTSEVAERVRRETRALGLDDGVLVDQLSTTAAIFAEVGPQADREAMLAQVRRMVESAETPGSTLAISGTAMAQATLGRAAARDLGFLVPLVILVLAVVLTLVFRHPLPALVALAEIGISLVITTGIMGMRGETVFVTTLVLPVILIVIGVSDDVYALNRYFCRGSDAPSQPARAIAKSFQEVASPILLTAVTTVVGLLSLTVADLEPQRIFGFYGAVSILISTLLTFTLVPAMLLLFSSKGKAREPSVEWLNGSTRWALQTLEQVGPRRLLVAFAVLAVLAGTFLSRLRIEDDWVRNLPPDSDIARGDRALNERLAGTIRLELLADSGKPRGVVDEASFHAIGALEDRLNALPFVGAVQSVFSDAVRVLASLEGTTYEALRQDLREERRQLSPVEIEQSLLLLSSLRQSPMTERLDAAYQRARLTVFLQFANYSRIAEILRLANPSETGTKVAASPNSFLQITPFGDGWISYTAVRLLVVGQVKSVLLALLADGLLLMLIFRSARLALLAMAPISLSVLTVFGCLALSGVPLGIANSMFAAIALGIGIDYSIHLVEQYRQSMGGGISSARAIREAFGVTAPAIIKSALAIAAGLSVLAFSEVQPNLQLGLLVCLSLMVCAVMTLWMVPSLVLALPSKTFQPTARRPTPASRPRRELPAGSRTGAEVIR